uniref:Rho guanine nucleotide exchange factor 15b n=1 Tax=Gasterosteus aculeatus aculeatus TaxID=481459 RepID=A0AAQ4RDJ6_GASAC
MSVQETLQRSPSPRPPKPRPDIPQKPPPRTGPTPPGGGGGGARPQGGKVRVIVEKFSEVDLREAPVERLANGAAQPPLTKRSKRSPTVKPRRPSLQPPVGAPPLPVKRKALQAENDGGDEVEGGRSAPDGKEVEVRLVGSGEAEVEHSPLTPLSPCCEPSCSCLCHLQRPGMKLIWEGGDKDEADVVEHRGENEQLSEEDVEVTLSGGEDSESEYQLVPELKKEPFHQSLDVLHSDVGRRLSDPGPRPVPRVPNVRGSPPVPPKRNVLPQVRGPSAQKEEEDIYEDNIYEATLPQPPASKAAVACKELPTPPRRSDLSSSNSDPTCEFQGGAGDMPPAVPPRMPRVLDGPVHGGILLPQPMLEEWRNLRHFPTSGPSPQTAPPPPPPKTDPRKGSIISLQPPTRKKEGEKNGGNEGEKEDAAEESRPVRIGSLRRMSSLSWESRLQDEPLYQTYRATVITKEIRRQTVCRNISKASVDYAMDWTMRRPGKGTAGGSPKGVSTPVQSQSTLWQDLRAVQEAGVLEQLTPEQCKYQESMFEVLTSETSYLRSLRVLTEHFLSSRELEETMIIRDKKTLFSNILKIREVSERFLKDLEEHIFKELVFPDICDIINYHAQHHFPAYIDYVRNQIYQDKTYSYLLKNNTQFATVITRLQESPQCQRLPFMSFLLLPFQRITRIKMLLENILRRTKEKTDEEQTALKALNSVSKIIDECNTEVGKMRQVEELYHVSKTLEFDKLKGVPIISQTRYLEKKGELQEMSRAGTIFNMRPKFNTVYLFLFNDLLIIAVKKGPERFVVLDYAHRSLVQAHSTGESGVPVSSLEHCFCLTLLENHQGRMVERLLRAPSQSDMHRWMAAFPNPTNPDQYEEEVVYEDWGEDTHTHLPT